MRPCRKFSVGFFILRKICNIFKIKSVEPGNMNSLEQEFLDRTKQHKEIILKTVSAG